jgi:hypothetical protein
MMSGKKEIYRSPKEELFVFIDQAGYSVTSIADIIDLIERNPGNKSHIRNQLLNYHFFKNLIKSLEDIVQLIKIYPRDEDEIRLLYGSLLSELDKDDLSEPSYPVREIALPEKMPSGVTQAGIFAKTTTSASEKKELAAFSEDEIHQIEEFTSMVRQAEGVVDYLDTTDPDEAFRDEGEGLVFDLELDESGLAEPATGKPGLSAS